MMLSVDIGPWTLVVVCLTIVVLAGILAWYKHHN